MIKRLNQLFEELQQIVPIKEIGFHMIKDGKLNPIHKIDTEELSSDKWKEIHSKNPQYIKDDPVLVEVVKTNKTVAISNTFEDERISDGPKLFGIKSLMVIPVTPNNEVEGIVVMPSMDRYHIFTDEEVKKCEVLVKEYLISHHQEI